LIKTPVESVATDGTTKDVRLVAAELEISKKQEDWFSVARIYNNIGDVELRDKYIELALQQDPSPFYIYLFARMQGKLRELSKELIAAALEEVSKDWTVRASMLSETGHFAESAKAYIEGIKNALDEGRWFLAAYYMRYGLNAKIVDELFSQSLRESAAEGNLWWQLRALEELGWQDSKRELLLGNENKIMESEDSSLILELAKAKGDAELVLKTFKEMSELGSIAHFRVTVSEVEVEEDTDPAQSEDAE
jgi:hypothetical protein